MALYGLLGAAGPAAANFDALSIKFIQHDTITGTSYRRQVASARHHVDHKLLASSTLLKYTHCAALNAFNIHICHGQRASD